LGIEISVRVALALRAS